MSDDSMAAVMNDWRWNIGLVPTIIDRYQDD